MRGNSRYVTTHDHCSCLDYKYRHSDNGTKCKHMRELEDE